MRRLFVESIPEVGSPGPQLEILFPWFLCTLLPLGKRTEGWKGTSVMDEKTIYILLADLALVIFEVIRKALTRR